MTRRLRQFHMWLQGLSCVLTEHQGVKDHHNGIAIVRCQRCWAYKQRSW